MATEGTYPFVGGGVSTWCHQLCEGVRDVDFTLLAVTGGPRVTSQYKLPPAVKELLLVPLWPEGDETPYVYTDGWSGAIRRRARTTARAVERHWLPPLRTVLREVFDGGVPTGALLDALAEMALFLRRHDYRAAMRARVTWGAFLDVIDEHRGGEYLGRCPPPTARDASLCARWFYHLMLPLALAPLRATVFHATIAASCALPGVVGRRLDGTRFALTEHGVYLRERHLAVSASDERPLVKRFLVGLATTIGRACYASADVISPVAYFNARWEVPWEAAPSQVRVIYNGVDAERFRPGETPPRSRPTAVVAARVFPLKDIETLVRAASVARARVPDLQVLVYGSLDADPPYVARCRALIDTLDLGECVLLKGFHARPHELYLDGDVCVLSSISEGFPYTVIESMACGVPCVATDVGGVREAIADTGLVVAPRDPEALGHAMAELLLDPERRRRLGEAARERASTQFTLDRQIRSYEALYRALAEDRRDGAARAS